MKKIFKFLNDSNRVIENGVTGFYTVVSPCSCKKSGCGNFSMSIYRDDSGLDTKLWITNDIELSMASHFFKQSMDTDRSLSKSILEDSKLILVNDEENLIWEN
jgi:hypothetical protein